MSNAFYTVYIDEIFVADYEIGEISADDDMTFDGIAEAIADSYELVVTDQPGNMSIMLEDDRGQVVEIRYYTAMEQGRSGVKVG